MKYRTTTVLARSDLGVSGTKIIDINLKDIVSKLLFRIEATVVNTVFTGHVLDCVSKIELVDGSDVLCSLSAYQMDGLHFLDTGKLASLEVEALYDTTLDVFTAMLFGRFLHDPELAFDPKQFTNPQLRITYDATAVMALATHVYLTVLAECFDEKVPSPVGFLRNTEHYRYTSEADTYKYIDLPTDLPLRKLIVQPKRYQWAPVSTLAEVRIDEDNLKRIPFDLDYVNLRALMFHQFGEVEYSFVSVGHVNPAWPLYTPVADMGPVEANNMVTIESPRVQGQAGSHLALHCSDTTNSVFGRGHGRIPCFMVCYPFGDQKDIDDWYDLAGVGSLKLRIKDGAVAPASTRVILQQLRRY